MLPEAVEQVLEIAARENSTTPEALEAYRARELKRSERAGVRDGVAILYAHGPMFKGANLMTEISGATSYDRLRRDLQTALDDDSVGAVLLSVDSPGGEAHGCDELAAAIYASRGKKPIHAHVSGHGCSGAYWLASAAEKITVSDLATIGSIGVVLGITERKKSDEARGITHTEFVSSQSPGKRPKMETDEGRAQIQKYVDDMAHVFVSAVAKYRGVSVDKVLKDFAQGGVEIGENARRAGMVDAVGQFEDVLQSLASRTRRSSGTPKPSSSAGLPLSHRALVELDPAIAEVTAPAPAPLAPAATTSAIEEFRARVAGYAEIDGQEHAPELYAALRDYTTVSAERAASILAAARKDFGTISVSAEDAYAIKCMKAGALGTENWTIGVDGKLNSPLNPDFFP
ncbi:S49 family peptidase [Corticibacterium sp. UT-5YL-CI-8]|nr:S49 family peptidase [Tianweitania sp. UT-5YL-CI-8]